MRKICVFILCGSWFLLSFSPFNSKKVEKLDSVVESEVSKIKVDKASETVKTLLSTMTLQEKIAQTIMVSVSGNTEISPYSVKAFKYVPGAVILFKFNFASEPSVVHGFLRSCEKAFESFAREKPYLPPFFATDNEGGIVFRTKGITSALPSHYAVASLNSLSLASELYRLQAIQMKALGLSLNLGPVSEKGDKELSVLGERLFSNDAGVVANYASTFVNAMQGEGIACAIKHFPGSGNEDTHHGVSTIDLMYKDFVASCEVFKKALNESIAVMVSHAIVPCIDEKPFCLSKKGIDFLKEKLGFSGLIMSDDIIMKALNSYGNSLTLACDALLAGCDLILYSASDFTKLIEDIAQVAQTNKALQARIDEAASKVLYAKIKARLISEDGERIIKESFDSEAFNSARLKGNALYERFEN